MNPETRAIKSSRSYQHCSFHMENEIIQSSTGNCTIFLMEQLSKDIRYIVHGILLGVDEKPTLSILRRWGEFDRCNWSERILVGLKLRNESNWISSFAEDNSCTYSSYLFLFLCTEKHIELGMSNMPNTAFLYSLSLVVDTFLRYKYLCTDKQNLNKFLSYLDCVEVEDMKSIAQSQNQLLCAYQINPRRKKSSLRKAGFTSSEFYLGKLEASVRRASRIYPKDPSFRKKLNGLMNHLKRFPINNTKHTTDLLADFRSMVPFVVEQLLERLFAQDSLDIEIFAECSV